VPTSTTCTADTTCLLAPHVPSSSQSWHVHSP